MIKIFKDIVHKLWMVDHHKNEPKEIREICNTVNYAWLKESSLELKVNFGHIKIEYLRVFNVETLCKNGVIYIYNPSSRKCLLLVKIYHCETRDVAAETLEKMALLQMYQTK
jgi:hypothetical protein